MRLSVWNQLVTRHATLIDAAAAVDPTDAAAITRLRRDHAAELVHAALALAAARRKARGKFPRRWTTLIADPEGVEQASSAAVAAHKATRFVETLGSGASVVDVCCGVGGDAMGFADAGLRVLAVDHDPLRAWMTCRNARCQAACADAMRLRLRTGPADAFHIDPARRTDRGRTFRLADYRPGPDALRELVAACPVGAMKLGPGIDPAGLDEAGLTGELEFVSEAGRLVQAVLWVGRFQRHDRTATLLRDDGPPLVLHGPGNALPIQPLDAYLFTVDPAVERAGLMGVLAAQLGVAAPHPKLGLLTADRPLDSPWLTGFQLLAQLPWRPRKVKAWLDAHDAGLVEVKTRGKAVDPDRAQAQLRGRGATPYAVFILRWDERVVALITRRL